MLYIKPERRQTLDQHADAMNPGELNYLLAQVCRGYLYQAGSNYSTMNDIVGALECAKAEFYRLVVAPFEDQTCREQLKTRTENRCPDIST